MGQRLLIVDGDRRFIKDHQVALEAAFDVDVLYSPEGAVERLLSGEYGAVLICVEIAENKGYALCSAIRKQPSLQDVKIALSSAKATEEEYARHRSLKGRADLYIHKPIASSALVAALTPLVPLRGVDPDNPLGDLTGADLGDEWLESLKAEIELDDKPQAPPPEELEVMEPEALEPEPAPEPSRPAAQPWEATGPMPTMATVAMPILAPPKVVPPSAGMVELLEERVKDLEAKLLAQADALGAKDAELAELRQIHESVTRNLDEMEVRQAEMGEIQEKLREAEEARRGFEDAVAQEENRLQALQEQLQAAQAEQQPLRERIEELDRQLAERSQDLQQRDETCERLQREAQEGQAALDERCSQEEALAEARGRCEGLEARVRELEPEVDRLRQMESEHQELQGRAEAQDARIEELLRQVEQLPALERALTLNEEELGQARQHAGELESQVSGLESAVQAAEAERDARVSVAEELRAECEALREDRAGLEATLRGQRRELGDQGNRLAGFEREVEELRSQLGDREQQLQSRSEDLNQLRALLEAREQNLQTAASEREELGARLAEWESLAARKDEALAASEEQLAAFGLRAEGLEAHCTELERQLGRMTGEHERQQLELLAGIDEREAQIGRLNSTLEAQRETLAAANREKQALEDQLAEREARVREMADLLFDLDSRIRRTVDLDHPA